MPMLPEHYLALARESSTALSGEGRWCATARFAYDAVFHMVAGTVGLDPATFAGNTRAVREALFAADLDGGPAFLTLARRHWNTLWLVALRAERSLDESVPESEARLSLALAERIFAARAVGLQ